MKTTARKGVFRTLTALLTLGLIAACGGEQQVADGGIRGTGSSVGPVSGFGSVFVNGVKFNTDGIRDRKVESNDGIQTEEDLNEGMILRIEGEWRTDGTGEADSMEYDDTLRGEISNLMRDASGRLISFEIYGQKVLSDKQTVFKGKTPATLANGDFVRVSAWRQPDGFYRASFTGFIPDPENFVGDRVELEGPVDKESVTTNQFSMNGVVIKFDEDSFAEGLSAESLQPDVYFEVEGEKELGGNAIVATRIQFDDFRRYRPAGDDIEIAGPISSGYSESENTFGLNDFVIQVTGDTELDDGIALADLKAGLLVQVEGEFVSGDQILATEIEVRDGDAEVSGTISANDVHVGQDSLSVGGVRVQVTSRSIITDDDSGDRLTIYNLMGPDADSEAEFVEVEVVGLQRVDDQGAVYVEALQIERELTDERELEYEIEGALTELGRKDISTSVITILGARIEVDNAVFEGTSHDDLERRLKENEAVILEVEYQMNTAGQYEALSVELD